MTPEQADNWRDFSRRMAEETHRWRTEARRKRVVEEVDHMIDLFLHNWPLEQIGDWDGHCTPTAPGIITQRYGRDHVEMAYPCDEFDRHLEEEGLSHWDERNSCERETDFASHVMCCIRAGFDVAAHPSAGVIGSRFTAGMIRRMFPEGLPPYIDDFFHGEGTNPEAPRFETLPNDVQVWL